MRVVRDVVGTPIKASDLEIGDLVNAEPEALFPTDEDGDPDRGRRAQVEKAKAAVSSSGWSPTTSLPARAARTGPSTASSATRRSAPTSAARSPCTSSTTHHVLCPCHQSTFDLADGGKVIFGPAARPLPQLPIAVDDEGYLVAQSDFTEPVGPSFWEREADEHRHQQGRHQQPRRTPRPRRSPARSARSPPGPTTASASPPWRKKNLRKVFPDHWSFMLGEIALWSFVVLLLTGVFLTLWFTPEHGRGRLRRLLRPAARHRDVGGVRLDAWTSPSTCAAAC